MIDLGFVIFAIVTFCLLVWPMLTYAGDAARYVWYRLKEVGQHDDK